MNDCPNAEREGFEPSVPFWSTHAFQASPFDRSGTSPKADANIHVIYPDIN